MEDTETPRMRKYGERKTTRIMMASVPHVTSGLGLRKFQADGFLLYKKFCVSEKPAASVSTRHWKISPQDPPEHGQISSTQQRGTVNCTVTGTKAQIWNVCVCHAHAQKKRACWSFLTGVRHWTWARGEFRPRQTRQLPRAVDLKGRFLSCQSY